MCKDYSPNGSRIVVACHQYWSFGAIRDRIQKSAIINLMPDVTKVLSQIEQGEPSSRSCAFWKVVKCGIDPKPIAAASDGASSSNADSFR